MHRIIFPITSTKYFNGTNILYTYSTDSRNNMMLKSLLTLTVYLSAVNAYSLCTESDWTGATQSYTFTPANNCSISSNGILSGNGIIDSLKTVDNFEINFKVKFGDLTSPSVLTANQFRKQDTSNFYNAAICSWFKFGSRILDI